MLVKSLSSGVAATPARMGFRSTYTMHATMAASSSSAWHLNRDSQNRPLTSSSLFAARAMNSFRRPMNQLRLDRRRRKRAIRSGCSARARISSSRGKSHGPPQFAKLGEESQPAPGHLPVGPLGYDIRTQAQEEMVVVDHDREGTDIDGEDGGQKAQPFDQPCFTVREIPAGKLDRIRTGRPGGHTG